MRIVVADAQVPFVEGGAELHLRALVAQLELRGHDVATVTVPFAAHPKSELLAQASAWRLLNLTEFDGRATDALIALRFPSYCARHPNKVAWVIHQHSS